MKFIISKAFIYSIITLSGLILLIVMTSISAGNESPDENPAVSRFREYLRLNSAHPNPNYTSCIKWLKKQSDEIGLEFHKIDFTPPALFTIRLTWQGSNPKLKSIMLNSHIDVVPADSSKWKYDPFSATKELNGDIYGRGSQDRKSLGTQYLEAVRRLKANGFKPVRTLHITYVPDEEVGGGRGMEAYVNSTDFKGLNIGMELDEGGVTAGDEYVVYYGERAPWQFKVTATGRSSHGGLMFEDNAGMKITKVIQQLLNFREKQLQKLKNNSTLGPGDITSINLSQLGGGFQPNIVPSEFWATFDMRIKLEPHFTFNDAEKMLDDICKEAGPGVSYKFFLKSLISAETKLDDSNIWWKTFHSIFDERGLTLNPRYLSGATDARFIRNAGFSAFGFVPLPRTEPLLHQDNEFLNEITFLNGIKMYEIIIPRLTSVDPSIG